VRIWAALHICDLPQGLRKDCHPDPFRGPLRIPSPLLLFRRRSRICFRHGTSVDPSIKALFLAAVHFHSVHLVPFLSFSPFSLKASRSPVLPLSSCCDLTPCANGVILFSFFPASLHFYCSRARSQILLAADQSSPPPRSSISPF